MLAGTMRYHSARQKVLAQNISNIDTPAYKAQDLKKLDFADLIESAGGLSTTSSKHFTGSRGNAGGFATQTISKPFEINPNGNGVVLEEQMAKISDTGVNYEVASALYRKFTQLYRSALGAK